MFLFLALGMRLLAHEMNGGCLMCLKKRPLIIIRDYGYLLMKATKTIISKVYNVSCNLNFSEDFRPQTHLIQCVF